MSDWLIDPQNDLFNYNKFISNLNNLSKNDILNLDEDTKDLITKCINPREEYFKPQSNTGLVVGYIQSGKTASMEAIANLARDTGYKIIIVLSGTVGSLTRQTRDRFYQSVNGIGWKRIYIPGYQEEKLNYELVSKEIFNSLTTWDNDILLNKEKRSIVIISMKNIPRMKKIQRLFDTLKNNHEINFYKIPTLIIDDECDHYSLNTLANQELDDNDSAEGIYTGNEYEKVIAGESLENFSDRTAVSIDEIIAINDNIDDKNFNISNISRLRIATNESATHRRIKNLRKFFPINSYLGYTATPYANLLISTWMNLSPDFHKLIQAGEKYKGAEYFFPNPSSLNPKNPDSENFIEWIKDSEIQTLKDFGDIPDSLNLALRIFILGVAKGIYEKDHLKYKGSSRSMMVHPSGETGKDHQDYENHRYYFKTISDFINDLKVVFQNKLIDKSSFNKEIEEFNIALSSLIKNNHLNKEPFPSLNDNLLECIEKSLYLIDVIEFNARTTSKIPDIYWYEEGYARIIIGGHGLDRGYTVEGLIVTYLPRRISNQMDTSFQRARFFGYHKNIGLVKIFISPTSQQAYEDLAETEKELRNSLREYIISNENSTKSWPRHFLADRHNVMNPTRTQVIGFNLLRDRRRIQICRDYQSHLLDEISLEHNQGLYKILLNDNRLKPINEVLMNSPRDWINRLHHKIILNFQLKDVYEFIKQIRYEGRSLMQISVIQLLIKRYMELNSGDLLCPIILMNDEYQSESRKGEKFVRTVNENTLRIVIASSEEEGQEYGIERFHHYEYLIDSNCQNQYPNKFPTLQVHNFNILFNKLTERQKEEIGVQSGILTEVPYFSFYAPNSFFTKDMIYGYEDD